MNKFTFYLLITLLCSTTFTTETNSADWPQWQGPDRNAMSKETGLLQEWPEDGPPLHWRINELGTGYSTPSIADGRIFGISNRGSEEVVWALSEADGKEIYAISIGAAYTEGMRQGIEGAGCTPTVDGEYLYAIGFSGNLVCMQVKDGSIVWQRSLVDDFGGVLPTWRYNESPLIDGEKLICSPGGDEITMVALNKMNGEIIWKNHIPNPNNDSGSSGGRRGGGRFRNSGASYSSPIAIDFGGQRQYVQFLTKGVVGVSASDGTLLWRYGNPANQMGINCSTPIYFDGQVFAASAYGAGGGLAKLSKDGENYKAEEAWFTKDMENHHGGMLIIDGCLYGANGGNSGGNLVCIDIKTGEVLWNERENRRTGVGKGSVAFADGRIYYRTEDGEILLIEPNREKLMVHGKFEQLDRTRQPAWSHPVIANGKLYIRDQDTLFCYDVKANN